MGSNRDKQEYWYFRTQEKWVFDADVQQIKNVPGIGYIIFVIYVELCARSIKNKGFFRINKTSPENGYAADLARLINEDAINTGHALSYLSKNGFVEIFEDEESIVLHLPVVDNNTGKSSIEADRIRAYERHRKIEEEHRLLLEAREERTSFCSAYGCFSNVLLADDEYQNLSRYLKDAESVIDIISINHKAQGISSGNDYLECLSYARNNKRLSEEGLREVAAWELNN